MHGHALKINGTAHHSSLDKHVLASSAPLCLNRKVNGCAIRIVSEEEFHLETNRLLVARMRGMFLHLCPMEKCV